MFSAIIYQILLFISSYFTQYLKNKCILSKGFEEMVWGTVLRNTCQVPMFSFPSVIGILYK